MFHLIYLRGALSASGFCSFCNEFEKAQIFRGSCLLPSDPPSCSLSMKIAREAGHLTDFALLRRCCVACIRLETLRDMRWGHSGRS